MIMEIYRHIDRDRLQFDFVTFPDQQIGFYNEIIGLGGRIYEAPRYNGMNHFKFTNWWDIFLKEHTEYRILHIHVRSVAAICVHVAQKYGCITIVHSHSTSNGSGMSAVVKYLLQKPIRYMADYLFACSYEAGAWLFGSRAIQKSNFKIVQNAIDSERFKFDKSRRTMMRESLDLEGYLVLGHIGRFLEMKNHAFLLEIFREVHRMHQKSKLLLVGDGKLREMIQEKASQLQISEDIVFVGNVNNTEDYYQAMDVFVFPSFWEGLGIVAVEAQASGLPCVVSDAVPTEADIGSDLFWRLSLRKSAKEWATFILSHTNRKREDMHLQVQAAGYDSCKVACMLQDFYIRVARKETVIFQ